jgi:hypothetical protein
VPQLTASWTTAQVESLSRRSLIERFLRETGLGDYGTATGGSTSTLIDTTLLQSTEYPENYRKGEWLRISFDAGAAGAAPQGEIRSVTKDEPEQGKLTVGTPFSAAPASGDKYQTFRQLHPQRLLDFIDQILTNDLWLPAWQLLTEVPDGDMEQSNTTDWVGTNATVTKATAEPALNGSRWLSVATTSANGYAESGTIRVIPGKTYHLSALVRTSAASTTAELIAYDKTNSAAITSKTSVLQNTARLWFKFAAPATCYQVSVRLANQENSKTSLWDDVVCFREGTKDIALPWWVKNEDQVKGVFRLRPETVGTNLWDSALTGIIDGNRWTFQDNAQGRGQLRLVAQQGTINEPLYIYGTRNEPAFTDENTDTRRIDGNWMQACLAYRVFAALMSSPNSGLLDMGWIKEQAIRWESEWVKENKKQIVRLEKSQQAVSPDGHFYRDTSYGGRLVT